MTTRNLAFWFGSDYDGDQHLIADAGEVDASEWIVEMWGVTLLPGTNVYLASFSISCDPFLLRASYRP